MEASSSTPTIPMLSIQEKKTSSVDLYNQIRNHIISMYSLSDAEVAEIELIYVRDMRNGVEKPSSDQSIASYESRLDLLLSYIRAISVIKSRLDVKTISFTWQDAFRTNKRATQKSMDFEKAAILFNIGAVHSQIGVMIDRGTDEGRKRACVEFQKAVGAFRLLKGYIMAGKVGPATVDLTVECVEMLEKLMFAHAQECYFNKAIADSKAPVICAKIAKQVGIYYDEAYKALTSQPLDQHFEKSWVSQVQLKSAYFYAQACYLYCTELHQKEEIGEEVARLKLGISMLSGARKSVRGVSSSLMNYVTKLETDMNRNLQRAEKENNEVYLIRIPHVSCLTELSAASLVKPASMAEALDISEENLFANFIPDFLKTSITKYSNMVDGIFRKNMKKIERANEISDAKLKEISLIDSIISIEKSFSMPVELKKEAEQIQERGGSAGLEAELKQLRDLKMVNQELVAQIEETLLKEESEDSQFRAQYGGKWVRPESATLNKNIKERLGKFAKNLMDAGVNDSRIEQVITDNHALLTILDSKPIESALPSLSKPVVSLDGTEDEIVRSLERSMSQVEILSQKRECLEEKLKEMKAADDILPKLLKCTSVLGGHFFEMELNKYTPICDEISQNIKEQEDLLIHIQVQNDKFAALFDIEEFKVDYEKSIKQIRTAIAKLLQIKENVAEEIKFYLTLQETLNNVKRESSDFVLTRNIQSHEMADILTNDSEYGGWRQAYGN